MEKTSSVLNPLQELTTFGQSVWLDYIRRTLITSGELQRLIDEDGLRGVTSNPSIFEKAIAGSTDYQDILQEASSQDLDAKSVYEKIAIRDIQDAADILRSVYGQTAAQDGYVSLEVAPTLAHDTEGTLAEARRLWRAVDRPNLLVKVPATPEGIPAIRQLIAEGVNVNVTLLFAEEVYEQVLDAYMSGLEEHQTGGGNLSTVASVASFFVSRIDGVVDAAVEKRLKTATGEERVLLESLLGKVAIANAKVTFHRSGELYGGARWEKLAAAGARKQRLLWASTSTKNPKYRDVLYAEELIGPDTVDTMPPATFNAFREHGVPRASLNEDVKAAYEVMHRLEEVNISMRDVTDKLLEDGVKQFADAFEKLLQATGHRTGAAGDSKIDRQTWAAPPDLSAAIDGSLEAWAKDDKVRRMWRGDASVWTGEDEGKWLGWLCITEDQLAHLQHLQGIAAEVKQAGFAYAVLLGMGGSSLCPEVLAKTFGHIAGYPELKVLDSTDPAQIQALEKSIDLTKSLFIVSSKSGSTLEPNIFKQYFFEQVKNAVGEQEAGRHFIAVTDPGSKMQQVAETDKFRHIFYGLPSIGGRYSALSDFGMAPAAIMGLDVHRFLDNTEEMVHACGATVPAKENPGVILGAVLGVAANHGRDKVTLIASPPIYDLGAWLEQLLAESTGKLGKGLIPVDREPLGPPEVYGNDRVFAYLRLENGADGGQDAAIDALEKAGHPVVRINVGDIYNLGEEMFRWEIATATAGSILGINAFNQPDVEASKIATKKITSEYETSGKLPGEEPFFEADGIKLFADEKNAAALRAAAGSAPSLDAYLKGHLDRLKAGDYFALLAYLPMNGENEDELQRMRVDVRNKRRVATCLGFGPRFLHSTGQAYKGGPASGVFLQLTCDDAVDLAVPGQKYTFSVVKAAQARGDFQVLSERGRRALRVHLPSDLQAGLSRLSKAIANAVS